MINSFDTSLVAFLSRKERLFAGEQLRERLPHSAHSEWKPLSKHRDPIKLLEESNRYRLPNLVPLRYGRIHALREEE